MTKTVERFKNTSRRIIDGDPLVWGDLKSFFRARVKKNVAMQTSRVKQITDETIKNYKVSRYQPPAYGLLALVDFEYYSEQSGVEFESAKTAFEHYKTTGAAEGLSPHRLFDPEFYAAEVSEDIVGQTPLEHFFETGGVAGFSPCAYFDCQFYLSQYSWTASQNPLAHYLCYGVKEGHNPFQLFDANFYVRKALNNESTRRSPVEHYMVKGWKSGINPHPLVDLEYLGAQVAPEVSVGEWDVDPLLTYLRGGEGKMLSPHNLYDAHFLLPSTFRC